MNAYSKTIRSSKSKGMFLLILAGFFATTNITARCNTCVKEVICDIDEKLDEVLCSVGSVTIRQEDLPYVITEPGKYTLCSNVSNLTNFSGSAISIQANNVTLNLNSYTIDWTGGSIGVEVTSGVQFITVGNGIIQNATTFGISVDANATDVNLINLVASNQGTAGVFVDQGVLRLNMQGVEGINTQGAGSINMIIGQQPSTIGGPIFQNMQPASGGLIMRGTSANPISDVSIKSCSFSNNTASNGVINAVGIFSNYANNIVIDDSQINNNSTLNFLFTGPADGSGNTAQDIGLGYIFFGTNNLTMMNTNVNGQFITIAPGSVSPPLGLVACSNGILYSSGIFISNCSFSHSTIINNATTLGIVDLTLCDLQRVNGAIVENCIVTNNSGPCVGGIHPAGAIGNVTDPEDINLSSGILINNCVVSHLTGNAAAAFAGGEIFGVDCHGARGFEIENCLISDLNAPVGPVTGIRMPAVIDRTCGQASVRNCVMERIFCNNLVTPVHPFGGDIGATGIWVVATTFSGVPPIFPPLPMENNIYGDIQNCTVTTVTHGIAAACLSMIGSTTNTVDVLPTITGIINGYRVIGCDFRNSSQYGINLDGNVYNSEFIDNTIALNGTLGVRRINKFVVDNNTWIRNILDKNGPTQTTNSNDPDLNPNAPGTPVRTWTQPGAPAPTDNNGILDPLDNINIVAGTIAG